MRRTALIALLLGLTAVPPAVAQKRGVFVDPESPAGKEYAIPLEQARREATGETGDRGGGAGRGQPLFGEGIERVERSGSGSAGGAGSGGAPGGDGSSPSGSSTGGGISPGGRGEVERRERRSGASPGTADVPPSTRRSAAIEAASAGGSDGLLTAGIAAAVLAAGLGAGFALRRVLRAR